MIRELALTEKTARRDFASNVMERPEMNDQRNNEQVSGVRDQEIRAALDQHWAASDANDFETEHRIYLEDAVLEYPQSGERTRGRRNIQNQRASQPNKKRFSIRRILGGGDLWVTELILTYDGKPSCTVSIMEFKGDKVARETQYFADPFVAPASRAQWVERMDNQFRRMRIRRRQRQLRFAYFAMEVHAMDWKGLVQFALMGNGNLEQYAILLVRVSIGLFFAISGANKLFVAGGTKPVYDTLVQAKIP